MDVNPCMSPRDLQELDGDKNYATCYVAKFVNPIIPHAAAFVLQAEMMILILWKMRAQQNLTGAGS